MTGIPANQLDVTIAGLQKMAESGDLSDSVYLLVRERK
jgi:hypothetical protein